MKFLLFAQSMEISKPLPRVQHNSRLSPAQKPQPTRRSRLSAWLIEWAAGQRVKFGLLGFLNCFHQLYRGIIYAVRDTRPYVRIGVYAVRRVLTNGYMHINHIKIKVKNSPHPPQMCLCPVPVHQSDRQPARGDHWSACCPSSRSVVSRVSSISDERSSKRVFFDNWLLSHSVVILRSTHVAGRINSHSFLLPI